MKRFPFGLTIAAGIAFAILVGLGAWQLGRLKETNRHKAQIAALLKTPPRPLGPLVVKPVDRRSLDHIRVQVECAPPSRPQPSAFRYSMRESGVDWRLLAMCRMTGVYDGVLLDRGRVDRLAGAMGPGPVDVASPRTVVGVLRSLGAKPLLGNAMATDAPGVIAVRSIDAAALGDIAARAGAHSPLPYYLAVEAEAPAATGLTPAPVTEDVSRDNFVYALTWFGLAGVLAWFYGALVWRRMTTA